LANGKARFGGPFCRRFAENMKPDGTLIETMPAASCEAAGTVKERRRGRRSGPGRLRERLASAATKNEADDDQYDGHDEKDLGEIGGESGNAAEAEERCDERDDGENDGPSEHIKSPVETHVSPCSRTENARASRRRQIILSGYAVNASHG
jgi:arginase family enzyme